MAGEGIYSIGQVAEMLNLPVHTIRFWTKTFNHIETERINGRRYYDNKSIEELKKIKELSRKRGMTIEGIHNMIRYNKINMEKINSVNRADVCKNIEIAITMTNKILEYLKH